MVMSDKNMITHDYDNNDFIITGDDNTRDDDFKQLLIQLEHDNNGMLFGIDLRGGAIRSIMNGIHETAPTLQAAESLVIRLMGTMMARYNALENARKDDIHLVEPTIQDVTLVVDDFKSIADNENAFKGIMCIRKIGTAVGFHVILGCSDSEWLDYAIKHGSIPADKHESQPVLV